MRAWALRRLPTIGRIMQALRLNEVLMRVVAWHNWHPLARRITAQQVHSIGEVVLPFASALPAPPAPEAAAASGLAGRLAKLAAQNPPAAAAAAPPVPADAAHATTGQDAGAADASEPLPAPDDPAADPGPAATESAAPAPAPAPAPTPDPATPDPPDPAPMLSMEDEADDLFAGDVPAPSPEAQADASQAAPDDDGAEMLVEFSVDLSDGDPTGEPDPSDQALQPVEPEPFAAPMPVPAAGPVTSQALAEDGQAEPKADGAMDAASAELEAAFAAATALDPATAGNTAAAADNAAWPAPSNPTPPTGPTAGVDQPGHLDPDTATPKSGPAEGGDASRTSPAADPSTSTVAPAQAPTSPAQPGLWARLLAICRNLARRQPPPSPARPRLTATFSRDFIWPLRPRQVARWARQHGSAGPLAPPDWPRRWVESDPALLAVAGQQGQVHALPLHLLTAAIGIGDRRIRVLMDGQGRIVGPRAYSRPKLALLAGLVAMGLLGLGRAGLPARTDPLAALEISAASANANATAAAAASAASAAESMPLAQQGDAPAVEAAPAEAAADAPAADPATAATPDAAQHGGADDPTAPDSPALASSAESQPTAPMASIVPVLSDGARQAARWQATALRNAALAPPVAAPPSGPQPVYAVVTRASRERDSAARSLSLIRASTTRLTGTPPTHAELLRNQDEWRAAWWPFDSLADAERARVMLTSRGLKAEVVEF